MRKIAVGITGLLGAACTGYGFYTAIDDMRRSSALFEAVLGVFAVAALYVASVWLWHRRTSRR